MSGAGRGPLAASASAWVELAVRLGAADAEIVADALGTLAEGGVALEPRIQPAGDGDFAYTIEPAGALVRAFLPAPLAPRERRTLRRRLAALPLREPLPRLRYRPLQERDWSAAWREQFTTLRVGRLVVRPSWEPPDGDDASPSITLDPGRAFGTGQHPTTRLCLAAIERALRPGAAVLDVGCGSGILALAAARLGAVRVDALDVEPEAIEVARENARRNGLGSHVRLAEGSLGAGWPATWGEPVEAYDLVVVNISSAAVLELLPPSARALRPDGLLVASGFMAERAAAIEAAARAAGLAPRPLEADGEWCALVAERSG